MFGLEILDVVIGLMFVYLLLSLLATALNEYVAALTNLRGKELARGVGRLLDDLDEKNALRHAFDGVGPRLSGATASLTERFYDHRLIRPLATRRGWAFRMFSEEPRLPSYIPARTFAMALLDVLGYTDPAATDPAVPAGEKHAAALVGIMNILKRESPLDVSELKGLMVTAGLPEAVQVRLLEAFTGSQNRLQHLHDGVEVWFNNAMDRVSGAYKRNVQGWLLLMGLLIASASNADTIDMWRRLAENDEMRAAMVRRAASTVAALDSVRADSALDASRAAADTLPAESAPGDTSDPAPADAGAAVERARENYLAARTRLDSMELKLGWGQKDGIALGTLKPDSTSRTGYAPDLRPWKWHWGPLLAKLLGLLLTAIAISLGAPFWFDLLNKVISIRSTGRSPAEKPKSPEGAPKRAAEQTPR